MKKLLVSTTALCASTLLLVSCSDDSSSDTAVETTTDVVATETVAEEAAVATDVSTLTASPENPLELTDLSYEQIYQLDLTQGDSYTVNGVGLMDQEGIREQIASNPEVRNFMYTIAVNQTDGVTKPFTEDQLVNFGEQICTNYPIDEIKGMLSAEQQTVSPVYQAEKEKLLADYGEHFFGEPEFSAENRFIQTIYSSVFMACHDQVSELAPY